MNYDQLDIKKKRVISYFIDAATRIATEEGLQHITIRKVAKEAGYTSGTLYNYFDNLDQLLEITAINCITDYLTEFAEILEGNYHEVIKMIKAWECYCNHSFRLPSIYTYVFSSSFSENVLAKIKVYAQLFPERLDLNNLSSKTISLLDINITEARNYELIHPCVESGYFTKEAANEITNFANIMHGGFIYRIKIQQDFEEKSMELAVQKFREYFIVFIDKKRQGGHPAVWEIDRLSQTSDNK